MSTIWFIGMIVVALSIMFYWKELLDEDEELVYLLEKADIGGFTPAVVCIATIVVIAWPVSLTIGLIIWLKEKK